MCFRYKRQAITFLTGIVVLITLSDQISSSVLKPYFGRLRPCNDSTMVNRTHLIVPCGTGKAFPSSHATNTFALAAFLSLVLAGQQVLKVALIAHAMVVSYSRIYVGVHFPADVLAGALLGLWLGICVYFLHQKVLWRMLGVKRQ